MSLKLIVSIEKWHLRISGALKNCQISSLLDCVRLDRGHNWGYVGRSELEARLCPENVGHTVHVNSDVDASVMR
jgi:hypothetical protein